MRVVKRKLGWTNKCCGCNSTIASSLITYILTNITGVNGSIHLCEKCIDDISNAVDADSE